VGRLLTVEIECGETTCAAEPGRMCPKFFFDRYDALTCELEYRCSALNEPLVRITADEFGDGTQIQRLPACLAAESSDPAGKLLDALLATGDCPDFVGITAHGCSDRLAGTCPAEDTEAGTPECIAVCRACWDKWLKGELK
jgi:hypothetical protein